MVATTDFSKIVTYACFCSLLTGEYKQLVILSVQSREAGCQLARYESPKAWRNLETNRHKSEAPGKIIKL